jgi:Domain of unknown function (DUF4440)
MYKIAILVLIGILGFLAPALHAQTAAELRAKAAEDEEKSQELVTLEKETAKALQLNSSSFFSRVYSDDYQGAAANGQVLDKQALVLSVQTSPVKYFSFVATEIKVRMFQDTAVVTCLWSARGSVDGRNFSRQSRVIHIYVYGMRGWKAVASQETVLPG